jgi:thiosulfate/3-mercaptopyruvate sulfurtransferase
VIDTAELARLIDAREPRLRLLDLRWYLGRPGEGRLAWKAGHIPGAAYLDLDDELTDPAGLGAPGRHPLPSPGRFAAAMAARGIRDDSLVVAYDDVGGWVAARLWWMLDDLRFGRPPATGSVRILDGGFGAWVAGGGSVVPATEEELRAAPADRTVGQGQADEAVGSAVGPGSRLTLWRAWRRVIERDALRSRLGSLVLLDARAGPRSRGETEPIDPVAGHIPTALSLPTDSVLGPDGRFLDPAALRDLFTSRGAGGADDRPTVTSCGSGVSACIHALAMRIAGLPDPILYAGSYSDWSRSGYPVATGPEHGPPAG